MQSRVVWGNSIKGRRIVIFHYLDSFLINLQCRTYFQDDRFIYCWKEFCHQVFCTFFSYQTPDNQLPICQSVSISQFFCLHLFFFFHWDSVSSSFRQCFIHSIHSSLLQSFNRFFSFGSSCQVLSYHLGHFYSFHMFVPS